MKTYVMNWKFVGILLLLVISLGLKSQVIKTRLDFAGGVSMREFAHIGARYQYTGRTQIGLYYGGDLGLYPEIIRTFAIDNMIHFGEHMYYSNRPVWYARQGYTYVVSTEADLKRKFSYIDISLGREFGINDWLGFNADGGIIIQVSKKTVQDDSQSEILYDRRIQWLPLLRVQVFISL